MAKQINFELDGTNYCLEFTRATVRSTEKKGFNADKFDASPLTMMTLLLRGAFDAHHASLSNDKRDQIVDRLGNRNELINALIEMYNEPLEQLIAENQGNTTWVQNW